MENTSKVGRFQARPKRVPLHDQRDTLTVAHQDPDRVYRWVNDVDNRIDKFKEAGYRTEESKDVVIGEPAVDTGLSSTSSIVTKQVGGKVKAVLMSTQKDWYEEDQLDKQKRVDQIDAAMRRSADDAADYGTLTVSKKSRRG